MSIRAHIITEGSPAEGRTSRELEMELPLEDFLDTTERERVRQLLSGFFSKIWKHSALVLFSDE